MTFILRWPSILVLLAVALLSIIGAAAAGAALANVSTPITADVQNSAAVAGADQKTWLDVGLWAAAGLFFIIAAVRLMRRTQGFWTWLVGFAAYGGRWAWSQQQVEGGVLGTVQGIDVNTFREPAALAADAGSPESQVAILGIILIVGLLVFIIDAADRAYWDKQGA